jgi:uncharacterized repeat protein (TIGR01451 family)
MGGGPPRLDYSRGLNPMLDESNLDEAGGIGLSASTDMTGFFCATPVCYTPPVPLNAVCTLSYQSRRAADGIDWNCSGAAPIGHISGVTRGDINGDRYCVERGGAALASAVLGDDRSVALNQYIFDGPDRICNSAATGADMQLRPTGPDEHNPLTDYDDWGHLVYAFQLTPDFDHGVHVTGIPDRELDLATYVRLLGPEPSITITPSVSGLTVTYTIRVINNSTSPAENILITDALPSQLAFVSCASTAGGVCGGTGNNRTVSFGSLGGGQTATITLIASLTCPGSPTTIVNTATLTTSSPDRIGGNNSAAGSVTALPGCSTSALPVSINRSVVTFNRATGRFSQTVVLTNLGPALPALAYVADALPAGVTMVGPTGMTSAALPAGSPYRELGPLAEGADVTLTVEFTRSGTPPVTYVPRLLGAGPR